MAPSKTTPSPKAKNGVNEAERIQRGLTKLETAFKDSLSRYGELLKKCKEGVNKTSNSTEIQQHKDVLCKYITSAVRGTYGNKAVNGKGTGASGSGGIVYSGLDRTHRCKFLRICMKYLIKNYCISDSDVKTILEAMKKRVESWAVGGDGSPEEKEKNRRAFGNCISKSWVKEGCKERALKCKVIKIIKESPRGKDQILSQLKSLSAGASVTCPINYDNSCNVGTAAAGGLVVDIDDIDVDSDVDSEEDDDDDEDEDDDVDATTTTKTTASSTQSPSLPPGNGNGKKGNLPFPSLSSFPFDSIHPYLPLVPPLLGIMTMTYFLWKYFGQLGKIRRFRRAPLRIPGPSVQEQVLDHVQQDSSHEYRLVKERKPRSAPARTKRSGRANRRTIIEIHFEVLDECQKGDTQLNQKDFLELLVQEFMGSELMEEEQVPKEEVLMEHVPILGSRLLV